MRKCGICGKLLGIGVVVHRECLENSKAEFDKINDFERSQMAVLLAEITKLKREKETLTQAIGQINDYYKDKKIVELTAENNNLKDRVEELEGQFAYECGCNQDLIQIQDENVELKKRLEKSVELPCKVGTRIFHIYKNGITEDTVFRYYFEIDTKPCVLFDKYFYFGTDKRVETLLIEQFNDCWFLTKEQAEQRLKEMRK